MRENTLKGIYIGFTLLISSILTLRLTNDVEGLVEAFNYFIPVLIGYMLTGVVIQWIRSLPHKSSEGVWGQVYIIGYFLLF